LEELFRDDGEETEAVEAVDRDEAAAANLENAEAESATHQAKRRRVQGLTGDELMARAVAENPFGVVQETWATFGVEIAGNLYRDMLQLYVHDQDALIRFLARMQHDLVTGDVRIPTNYFRSSLSKERRRQGLWVE